MKFITRLLETNGSGKFIFQQNNGRDVLKGSEIADEKLDLANEMKSLTQDLSEDVLESIPNEKDLQLVNPDAIHEFISRHLPGGVNFDEAEIKKIVVKRSTDKDGEKKIVVKIKRKGLQNDIIIKVNDKRDKVKIKERRKGKDLKVKYKNEEFKKEKQPIHQDIDFSMSEKEWKDREEQKNKKVVLETKKTVSENKKTKTEVKENKEILPEKEQNELYNELKGKINMIMVPTLDQVILDASVVDKLQSQIDALQTELNAGKPKMTPERGVELQDLLDAKNRQLNEVKKQAEVYGIGSKEVLKQEEIAKKQTEELNKKLEQEMTKMAQEFEKRTEKLQAMAENQVEAFESVKNGFELTPTNFDANNLNTREGVSQEFLKYQMAEKTLFLEAGVLESGAMEMQDKYMKFEEEKNEWSWKNAGKFVTGLVTTATFVGPLFDWGSKIFGSKKTLNSRIWGEGDEIDALNKDKEDFVAGLDNMAQKLDAKKKAIDAHGEALNNAVTKTLPDNLEAQKQNQVAAVELVVTQAEAETGVKLPRDKVEGLKNDLVERIEKSEGLQVEGLKNNVETGTKEISLEMNELMLNVAEYPAAFKEVEFQANDGWEATLGFLGKGIADAGDWIAEGSKDGWPVFSQIGGAVGGVVRGVGHLVDGVGTALSRPDRLVNGIVGLVGVDFLQEGADDWKWSELWSWDRFTGTWGNLFNGFFAGDAWDKGEHSAAIGESIFNVVATIFTYGGTGAVRGGSILAKTTRAFRMGAKAETGLMKVVGGYKGVMRGVGRYSSRFAEGGGAEVARVGGNLMEKVKGYRPGRGLKNSLKRGVEGVKNLKPKKLLERGKNALKKKPKSLANQLKSVEDDLVKATDQLNKLKSAKRPFLRKRSKAKQSKAEIRELEAKIKDLNAQRSELLEAYSSMEVKSFDTMKSGGKEFELLENGETTSYRFQNENWEVLSKENGQWKLYEGPSAQLQNKLRQQIQLENGYIEKASLTYKQNPSLYSRVTNRLPRIKRPSLRAMRERMGKRLNFMQEHWPYIIVPAILENKSFVDAKKQRVMELFVEHPIVTEAEKTPVEREMENVDDVAESAVLSADKIKETKVNIQAATEGIKEWEIYIAKLRKNLPEDQMKSADAFQELVDEIKPAFETAKENFEAAQDGTSEQLEAAQELQAVLLQMVEINREFDKHQKSAQGVMVS